VLGVTLALNTVRGQTVWSEMAASQWEAVLSAGETQKGCVCAHVSTHVCVLCVCVCVSLCVCMCACVFVCLSGATGEESRPDRGVEHPGSEV
jgi:hypothetical protein